MKKNIVIDDFGRTPEVSNTILKVVKDIPNINEVAVMVGFVNLSIHNKLKKLKIKTSLHINLTDNIDIKNLGKNLSFIKLLFLSKKKRRFIYKEIDYQIKEYQKLYGLINIQLNGHEHVHSIPWIYEYLNKNKYIKNMRFSNEKFLIVLKKINFFVFMRNLSALIVLRILNICNKKKSNKIFFGLLYTNYMCKKVYKKINEKYNNHNVEILFHPGKANKTEKDYFSHKKYFNYFTSSHRVRELKELYEIKKNISNY